MKRTISALIMFFVLASLARAQFIGYTSPQTVSQILATNVACTGSVQSFKISNFAQSSHVVNFSSSGATGVQVSLEGSWDGTNFFGFSDVAADLSGQLQATGYFPSTRVDVVCQSAAGTFSLLYAGTSSYQLQPSGFADRAGYQKLLGENLAANVNSGTLVSTTPYGLSDALLYFQYTSNTPPAGSTFSITAQTDQTSAISLLSGVTLQATLNTQVFLIPAMAASQLNFSYISGGASASVYTVQIVYFKAGAGIASGDPCQTQWGVFSKASTPVIAGAAATTQLLTTPPAGLSNYVCGFMISQAVLAGTIQFVYGTGVACGTGTNNLTGAMQTIVGQPFVYSGPGFVLKAPPGNAICLVTTGAGATAAGVITSVASP